MRIINKSQEKIQDKTVMLYWFVHGRSWVKFQAKNKDYKIDIGYNSANIAVVKCKLGYVIGLFCVGMMYPWNNC